MILVVVLVIQFIFTHCYIFNLLFVFCRFLRFNHTRIPRINLLNRNSDVTPDGRYKSALKDEKKRFSATLGTLSGGRVSITGIGVSNLKLAITIAIR